MPTVEPAPSVNYSESQERAADAKDDESSPIRILPTNSGQQIVNGIEVMQQIIFRRWVPGKEYNQFIVLRNISAKTRKIKFSTPSTRVFSTLYPIPLTLGAGTSYCLPITFRPLENVRYNDYVTFRSEGGTFVVLLLALLPEAAISVPISLDFQMRAVSDSATVTFNVVNTGDLDTMVEWQTRNPFTMEPSEAYIKVRSSCQFSATFRPKKAAVYENQAVCLFGMDKEQTATVTLKGIGKYPYLLVSTSGKPSSILGQNNPNTVINFGPTPVGSKNSRWVELHNLFPMRAHFRVDNAGGIGSIDRVFSISQRNGVVPAHSSIRIPVTFSPNLVNITSIDYFYVEVIGKTSKSTIKCVGSSKGPAVQLSTNSINFMQIDEGQTSTRTVAVINTSDVDGVYQFVIDGEESVFAFEQTSGVVKAGSKVVLPIKFIPSAPISFYRRVACLVHNHDPLYLDLLGTCHADMVKPAVLLSQHIQRFNIHKARGLSLYPPLSN